ncbi:nuclear transport factor 2 family protein [Massilia sp. W12]|uniref:nuclear transport factor 2 family protein n=1 Tax=Massilia sp. W12 TaxID=3126507 RepID=UPI0030CDD6D3
MPLPYDPAGFAQRQLDAYNARDVQAFVREYTADVQLFRLGEASPFLSGREAMAAHYRDKRFNLPWLHAALLNRMVFGNKVIDQEAVRISADGPLLECAAIYEVCAEGICKVWFVADR